MGARRSTPRRTCARSTGRWAARSSSSGRTTFPSRSTRSRAATCRGDRRRQPGHRARRTPSHPGTTSELLAEGDRAAIGATRLPPAGAVDLSHRHADGDGSSPSAHRRDRFHGQQKRRPRKLKAAADAPASRSTSRCRASTRVRDPAARARRARRRHGRGVLHELPDGRGPVLHESRTGCSCLAAGAATDEFLATVGGSSKRHRRRARCSPTRSPFARRKAASTLPGRQRAEPSSAATAGGGAGYQLANTLLQVPASNSSPRPQACQTEAFGNASLVVIADDVEQRRRGARPLEGNLTGCIYSDTDGARRPLYSALGPALRRNVGRLAQRQDADRRRRQLGHEPRRPVSGHRPPRLHRGRHPGVAAALRGAALLRQRAPEPPAARAAHKNPTGRMWRLIDGQWTPGGGAKYGASGYGEVSVSAQLLMQSMSVVAKRVPAKEGILHTAAREELVSLSSNKTGGGVAVGRQVDLAHVATDRRGRPRRREPSCRRRPGKAGGREIEVRVGSARVAGGAVCSEDLVDVGLDDILGGVAAGAAAAGERERQRNGRGGQGQGVNEFGSGSTKH